MDKEGIEPETSLSILNTRKSSLCLILFGPGLACRKLSQLSIILKQAFVCYIVLKSTKSALIGLLLHLTILVKIIHFLLSVDRI